MRTWWISFLAVAFAAGAALAGPVTMTYTTVTVATTSTTAVAADPTRKLLELTNISDTAIDCNMAGGTAVASQGVRIHANGGSRLYDIGVPFQAIECIHAGSGTKTLLVGTGK